MISKIYNRQSAGVRKQYYRGKAVRHLLLEYGSYDCLNTGYMQIAGAHRNKLGVIRRQVTPRLPKFVAEVPCNG